MWFLNKLKSGKWYECGDNIYVAYIGDGVLNIKFKGSTVRMDVPSFVSYEWYKSYMQEQEVLAYQQYRQDGGQQEQDFSRATDEQLEMLLSDLIEGENYMGCIRVRNEIEKRKKKKLRN